MKKPSASVLRPENRTRIRLLLAKPMLVAAIATWCFAGGATALAGPEGGQIVAGQGEISLPSTTSTQITQASDRIAIDWQTFNVATNESVTFEQPTADSIALNRILDQNPSQILGAINANGQVFLLNPNGMVFGESAQINVAGLLATSMDLRTDDFMSGNIQLEGGEGGLIHNKGVLQAAPGGYVVLAGGAVLNEGVILADLGTIQLAAGSKATLDFQGDGLLLFEVDQAIADSIVGVDSAVANRGELIANGGRILLTASAARDVYASVINNTGIARANRIENIGGVVHLAGSGGDVMHSGTIDVSGDAVSNGGEVVMTGDRVGLFGSSVVNADGGAGGGNVYIGGGFQGSDAAIDNSELTFVSADATITANAGVTGDGGEVIVWSDGRTIFSGEITARGGDQSGDGGFAEVSGKSRLVMDGDVDLQAPNGETGTLLLDPTNIRVVDVVPVGETAAELTDVDEFADLDLALAAALPADRTFSYLGVDKINTATSNVTLQATQDIDFETSVLNASAGVGLAATAQAGSITLDSGVTISVQGDLTFTAGTSIINNSGTASALNASSISLFAGTGGIGSLAAPLTLTTSGLISAGSTNGGIWLSSPASMRVNAMNAADDIVFNIDTDNSGADILNIVADSTSSGGSVSYVGSGDDVLQSSDGGGSAWSLQGGLALNGNSASGFTFLQGDADTLSGTNAADVFSISSSNGGSVGTFTFAGMNNLNGLGGTDTFAFNGGSISGGIDGGGSADELDYTGAGGAVTVNLNNLTATGVGTTFASIEGVTGNGAGSQLIGSNSGNTWTIRSNINNTDVNGFAFDNVATLTGGTGIDTFNFTANNADVLAASGGNGNDIFNVQADSVATLSGGAGTDTFAFNGGSISGGIDGGGSADLLDYTGAAGAVTVNLNNLTATGVGTTFASIEGVTGNGAGSQLIGSNAANTWTIGSNINNTDVNGFAFDNVATLTGGTGVDTFNFTANNTDVLAASGGAGNDIFNVQADSAASLSGAAGADTFAFNGGSISGGIDGGGSADLLDYTGAGGAVTVNLNDSTATGVGTTFTSVEGMLGNGADSQLIGSNANSTWTIGSNISNTDVNGFAFDDVATLTGGTGVDTFNITANNADVLSANGGGGNDIFNVQADSAASLSGAGGADTFAFNGGSISGGIDGGGSADVLDYTGAGGAVTVNLNDSTATGVGTTFTSVEGMLGNGANSELLGANANSTWTIGSNISNTDVNGFAFDDVATLTGGTGVDTFNITANNADVLSASGGAGNDVFNVQADSAASLSGDAGADTFAVQEGFTASSIDGGANLDTLSALGAAGTDNTWSITGVNEGTLDQGTGPVQAFAGLENLQGDASVDTFAFNGGSMEGGINGGTGADQLNYSGVASAVVLNLNDSTATGIGTSFASVESMVGNGANSQLVGLNTGNTWTIGSNINNTDVNGFAFDNVATLTGGTGIDTFNFTANNADVLAASGGNGNDIFNVQADSVATLSGGAGTDTFAFNGGSISGGIDGGGSADLLDYTGAGGAVTVNLNNSTATGVGTIFASIEGVTGNGAGSQLIGSNAANTWTIGSNINNTDVNGFAFDNVATLTGGTGIDTFNFTANNTDVLAASGGAGNDIFNVQADSAASLSGAGGADTFAFNGGSISGGIDGGGSADVLDYTGAGGAVTVNLNDSTATGVGTTFTSVEGMLGNGAGSQLIGSNAANTWTIGSNINNTDVNGFAFDDVATLAGGTGVDTFNITANNVDVLAASGGNGNDIFNVQADSAASLSGAGGADTFAFNGGSISGGIDGGGSADVLDYTGAGGAVTVNLNDSTATGVGTTFTSVEGMLGNGANSELLGANANSTWTIGSNISNTDVNGFAFDDVATLTGGTGVDTFNITANNADVLSASGGAGNDVFNVQADSAASLSGDAGADTFAVQEGFTASSIDGGANLDTLSALGAAGTDNTWSITGVNEGTLDQGTGPVQAFAGLENLQGDASVDTFAFNGGSMEGGINGGTGADQLNYSGVASAVVLNLNDSTATGIGTSFASVESMVGNGANSQLVGLNTGNTWTIGSNINNTNVNGFAFDNVATLTGGTGIDTFNFTANNTDVLTASGGAGNDIFTVQADSAATLSGGGGADTFAFSGGSVAGGIDGGADADLLNYAGAAGAVAVNLNDSSATGVGTNFVNVEGLLGNGAGSQLIGNAAGSTWTIGADLSDSNVDSFAFDNVATLTGGTGIDTFNLNANNADVLNVDGGAGNDIFNIQADSAASLSGAGGADTFAFSGGSVAGGVDGGADADLLNYAGAAGVVAVNLNDSSATGVGTNFVNVEGLLGNGAGSQLIGNAAGSTWTIGADLSDSNVDSFAFDNVATLTGGTGIDTFNLNANNADVLNVDGGAGNDIFNIQADSAASLSGAGGADTFAFSGGSVAGGVDGGADADLLNYAGAAGVVAVNLNDSTATGIGTTFANVEGLVGNGANSELLGANAANTWTIGADLSDSNVDGFAFDNVATLTGGTGVDTFNLEANNVDVLSANGGAGNDIFNVQADSAVALLGGSDNDTFSVQEGFSSNSINGGAGLDVLAALGDAGTDNTWSITGADTGTLDQGTGPAQTFAGVESLRGDSSADTFAFNGGSLTGGINGGVGTDLLNYSGVAGTVVVNLNDSSATGVGTSFLSVEGVIGNGTASQLIGNTAGSSWTIGADLSDSNVDSFAFDNVATLTGGAGADTFNLDANNVDVLSANGGAGNDVFNVRADSVAALLGGAGADTFAVREGFSSSTIDGGADLDVLAALGDAGTDNTWSITGVNAGTLDQGAGPVQAFAGLESLQGDSDNDSFAFNGGSMQGGVDGGAGRDLLNYTGAGGAVVVNPNDSSATGVGTSFAGIEGMLGNGAGSQLIGNAAGSTWTIGADINDSNVDGFVFDNVAILTGGAGVDTFNVNANNLDVLSANGGAGNDIFNVQADSVAALLGGAGADTFAVREGFSSITIDGGADLDVLAALGDAGTDNTWSITGVNAGTLDQGAGPAQAFAGLESLQGDGDSDTFFFNVGGSMDGGIDGGAGTGLDLLAYANGFAETVNLNDSSATGVGIVFVNIEGLLGSFSGELIGSNAGSIWTIGADLSDSNVDGFSFDNVATLTGGLGVDTFNVNANNLDILVASGGAGNDVFNVRADSVATLSGGAGADTFAVQEGFSSNSIDGGADLDVLAALGDAGTANTWNITGVNAGTLDQGSGPVQAFAGLESLQGDSDSDSFAFNGGSMQGGVDGGAGTDLLSYTGTIGAVAVDLNDSTATGVGTNYTNVEGIVGNGADSQLIGLAAGSVWTIGADISDSNVDGFSFDNVATLTGGSGVDRIDVLANNSDVQIMNAGAGNDSFTVRADSTATLAGGAGADTFAVQEGFSSTSIDGGADLDVLSAFGFAGTDNTWTITGVNAGTLDQGAGPVQAFAGLESLQGDTDNDTFAFNGGSMQGGIDGGAGSDLLSYAGTIGAVVVNLNDSTATGVGTNYMNVEGIVGNAADSQLIGLDAGSTWTIGTDINDSNVDGFAFDNVATLTGGTGVDTFNVNANNVDILVADGGGGNDFFNVQADSAATLLGGVGADTFAVQEGFSSNTIDGGADLDVLAALGDAGTDNTWSITGVNAGTLDQGSGPVQAFAGLESLQGDTDNDTFAFNGGTMDGGIDGGAGTDLLNYLGAGGAVTINLNDSTATGVGTSFANVEGAVGTAYDIGLDNRDVLIGLDAGSIWTIGTDSSDSSVDGFVFAQIETLVGGTGIDTFNVNANNVDVLAANGGAGNDVFNVQADSVAALLGGAGADTFAVQEGFSSNTIDGGADLDVLAALGDAGTSNTWSITGVNAGTLDQGAGPVQAFAGLESLQGDSDNDTFAFNGGSMQGGVDGGAGTDLLNYTSTVGTTTVNLNDSAATGVGTSFVNVEGMVGNGASSQLIGNAAGSVWTIGADISDSNVDGFSFDNVATLTGGSGADLIDVLANNTDVLMMDAGAGNDIFRVMANSTAALLGGAGADTFAVQEGFSSTSIDGGADLDVLAALGDAGTANTWSIIGVNAGTLDQGAGPAQAFAGLESLQGDSDNDTFAFNGGSMQGGIDGGAGTDLLNYSGAGTAATINLNDLSATGVGTSFVNVEGVVGNGTGDQLIGLDAGSIWTIGTDFNDSNVDGFIFDNVATLTGGSGVDTFNVNANNVDVLSANGGAGDDIFNVQADSVAALLGGAGNDTFAVQEGFSSNSINGGAGLDALAALGDAGTDNTWTITGVNAGTLDQGSGPVQAFAGLESLQGDSDNDSFAFNGGSMDGGLDGGAGTDVLNYLGAGGTVTINLSNSAATGVGTSFASVEGVVGNGAGSQLIGNDAGSIWTIGADINDSNVDGFVFDNVATLTGGSGVDTFNVNANNVDVLSANGGAGDDVFNVQADSVAALLGGAGNDTFAVQEGFSSNSINGGAGLDALAALGDAGTDNTWTITGVNAGTLDQGSGPVQAFAGLESLQGDSDNDTFAFNGGNMEGGIDGDAGTNLLNYTGAGGAVVVNLNDSSATGVGTNFVSVEGMVGNGARSQLIGNAAGSIWMIGTDISDSNVDGFIFDNVATLTGGSGVDTFNVNANNADVLSVDGGAGNDVFNVQADSVAALLGGIGADTFAVQEGFSSTSIDGGADLDVLAALGDADTDNTWSITGVNQGVLDQGAGPVQAFAGLEGLQGDGDNDTFAFNGGSMDGGVDGGAGTDLLDYTGAGAAATINLNDLTATGVGTSFANVEGVVGNGAGDQLIGNDAGGTWTIGTDINDSNVDGFAFDNVATLTGGSGVDTFNLNANNNDILVASGGAGNDVFNVQADSVAALLGGAGADTFAVREGFSSNSIDGGADLDTLAALGDSGTDNTWSITGVNQGVLDQGTGPTQAFAGLEGLAGDGDNDTFAFNGGFMSGGVDGGAGTDVLDYLDNGFVGGAVTINLNDSTATGVGTSFANIEGVVGTAYDANFDNRDVLVGLDAGSIWTIGTGSSDSNADGFIFAHFETLVGGTGIDTFNVNADNLDVLVARGGAGDDVFNLRADSLAVFSGGAGADTFAVQEGFSFNSINGGAGLDTLAALGDSGTDNTWDITGTNAGSLNQGSGPMQDFAGLESLAGDGDNDTFVFNGGSMTGSIDGGAGTDILDYSGNASAVTVSLTSATDGVATNVGTTFSNMDGVIGSAMGDDQLIGPNSDSVWQLGTGSNVNNFSFSAIEFTQGGTGADIASWTGSHAGDGYFTFDGGEGNDSVAVSDGVIVGDIDLVAEVISLGASTFNDGSATLNATGANTIVISNTVILENYQLILEDLTGSVTSQNVAEIQVGDGSMLTVKSANLGAAESANVFAFRTLAGGSTIIDLASNTDPDAVYLLQNFGTDFVVENNFENATITTVDIVETNVFGIAQNVGLEENIIDWATYSPDFRLYNVIDQGIALPQDQKPNKLP